MTPEETREAAAIMLAWADGKPIECRHRHARSARWGPYVGTMIWDWSQYDFRLVKEPIEREVWVHADGMIAERTDRNELLFLENGWRKAIATIKEIEQ